MLPTMLLWLNYLDFFIDQIDHSKIGLQTKLMRYDTSSDADTPNKLLMPSVNGP